ncbi:MULTISPECIES: hypothetical protein [Leuconostoc]|uniref:hypothetical protein n=1 Tax=Leuconostoc TaxID=1243 RepID=UPI0009FC87E2|nr:hypothetical protein [Leuconostoc sp. BM2]ORI75428.1 hypothetical protein BMS65_00450 [Leuconostoc pseudomesenteroides]ORM44211.1 hypothetical protein BMG01_00450 [Leuconostoc sp. BM2]
MTEPVAYMLSDFVGNDFTSLELPKNPNNPRGLYFKEQLHPRVKMTQVEFDEFKLLYNLLRVSTVIRIINTVQNNESKRFTNLKLRLNKTGKDLELIILWADYDADNPEETIEIVPEMKWFVRSKQQYQPDMDQGIFESGYLYLTQGNIYSIEYYETTAFKDDAQQFDTKEEAELLTNPLTEAVQLPVEDE